MAWGHGEKDLCDRACFLSAPLAMSICGVSSSGGSEDSLPSFLCIWLWLSTSLHFFFYPVCLPHICILWLLMQAGHKTSQPMGDIFHSKCLISMTASRYLQPTCAMHRRACLWAPW